MGMLRKWCQKCSHEIQGSDPIASLTSSGSELHHLMVTAAKADPDLNIPVQLFLVSGVGSEQITSSSITYVWKLFWMHSRSFLNFLCLIVLPVVIEVVKVPHEDQHLQMWGFLQLSEDGLIYFFLNCNLVGGIPPHHWLHWSALWPWPISSQLPHCYFISFCLKLLHCLCVCSMFYIKISDKVFWFIFPIHSPPPNYLSRHHAQLT